MTTQEVVDRLQQIAKQNPDKEDEVMREVFILVIAGVLERMDANTAAINRLADTVQNYVNWSNR